MSRFRGLTVLGGTPSDQRRDTAAICEGEFTRNPPPAPRDLLIFRGEIDGVETHTWDDGLARVFSRLAGETRHAARRARTWDDGLLR